MIPQVYFIKYFYKDLSNPLQQYAYKINNQNSSKNFITLKLLTDKKENNNNVIDLEMDALFKEKKSNESATELVNFENDSNNYQNDLVIWDRTNFEENWWSACQLPVFIVIVTILGLLAISFVIILWLKTQMIQSEKNKKIVVLDNKQIQLSSNSCPNPTLPPTDSWICHTVINLKRSSINSEPEAVNIQPVENQNLPDVLGDRVEVVEKRPAAVKIKAKGLLERRGSSASLTIDLPQTTYDSKIHVVTPTRECMSEEFLLSAGNVLNRYQLKNCLKNVQSLHQEFWEIPLNHPEKSCVTGCGTKNRYESILPNEKTRVKLNEREEHSLDAYINANYIRGYDGEERAYIATQGPLPNTIEDLYRMAWNERSPIIVMITKFLEKTKVKCESYFPIELNETGRYGNFLVTVTSLQQKEGYSVRELLIQNECETRKIIHYWYDTWPDHKTPQNAQSIVAMATEIEKYRELFRNKSPNYNDGQIYPSGPIIVHCSAGIGRTGCFIAISLAICQLLEEDKVDILGIVCQMRCDRGGMIQTAEQYEFVHRAIALFECSLPESKSD